MNQKITFDFTQGVEVEVAVMPANLAQKLLAKYAESLTLVPTEVIIGEFLDSIRRASKDGLAVAVEVARAWADERALITNIAQGNWDAYVVKPMEEEKTSINGPWNENSNGVKVIGKIKLDEIYDSPHDEATAGV